MTDTAFTTRQNPWYNITKTVDGVQTAAEAIKAGGLDWTVSKMPQYYKPQGVLKKVPDSFVVVRDHDDLVLGKNIGSRYKLFQNSDVFEFADKLVDSGEAKYSAVGTIKDGRSIFIVMDVPEHITVGATDEHAMHILFRTSHDGSLAVSATAVMMRLSCTNMLNMVTRGAQYQIKMQHNNTLESKLARARDSLAMTFQYAEEFKVMGNTLINTKVTDSEIEDLLNNVVPQRPRSNEIVDGIVQVYRDSSTNGFQGTGWGAMNAITEYFDHYRELRSDEARFYRAMTGDAAKIRNEASRLLLASA